MEIQSIQNRRCSPQIGCQKSRNGFAGSQSENIQTVLKKAAFALDKDISLATISVRGGAAR